jgi:beta-lactamase regulating signal transducer with metallopeptidase domain
MQLLLIDAAAKATVLLGAAALTTLALRRASAAARHLVWTIALLAALALPALTLALPRWQVPLVTLTTVAPAVATAAPVDEASGTMAERLQRKGADRRPAATSVSIGGPVEGAISNVSWPAVVLFAWLAGAMLILGRLAVGIIAVQVMSRRTERVVDGPWLPLAKELATNLGVTRITFRRSASATMPMAWGVINPSVVMPAEADAWPQDRLRIVLLHELAHVKRRDCLTHMLAHMTCALYWINPLAWMAAKRVRAERERACDDLVLAAGTRGSDYADQLLEIARVMSSGRFPGVVAGASLAMAHRSQLEGRLMAILDPTVPRSGVSRLRTTAAATLAMAALVPLASMQPWTNRVEAAALQQPATVANPVQAAPIVEARPSAVTTRVEAAATERQAGEQLQRTIQRTVENVVPEAVNGALDMVFGGQNPNPNPNPNPSPNPDPRYDDRQPRAKADPKLVAALTGALKDSDKQVREAAMHALVQMRDPSIFEPLVAALKDEAPDVREQAAVGLGQMRDKRALTPLIGAMKDSNADVREQAAFALGQLRDRAAVDALAEAVKDSDPDVREQAIFALGQLRDPKSVEPFISALKDSNADVRQQAAFGLGQLRAAGAVEALVIALKDGDADVREQAAFALGQIRDPRAIDGLTTALKDANASVRQQAAFALGQLAR